MSARGSHRGGIRLDQLGEDRLLRDILHGISTKAVACGAAGDDCAVVKSQGGSKLLVLKTDCVVERVHFSRGTNGSAVGWKAMMRPLSDFAATSAVPEFALITLIVPEQLQVSWVKELYRGLRRAADRFKVSIVGGETSSTRGPIVVSTSVAGFVEPDRHWAAWLRVKKKAFEFHSAHSRVAVADEKFLDSRNDGSKRRARNRSPAFGARQQTRIQDKCGEIAARPWGYHN